ncbi:hypothetical protein NL676_019104 [Syzygium grande]|nr:hypothetical protein NL676_019104 [Syzygium grande]
MVTSYWCLTICKNRERTSVARCEAVSHGGDAALRLTRGTRIVVDARRDSQQQLVNVAGAVCSRSGGGAKMMTRAVLEDL